MEVRDCNPKACRRHRRALSFLGGEKLFMQHVLAFQQYTLDCF